VQYEPCHRLESCASSCVIADANSKCRTFHLLCRSDSVRPAERRLPGMRNGKSQKCSVARPIHGHSCESLSPLTQVKAARAARTYCERGCTALKCKLGNQNRSPTGADRAKPL